LGFTILLQFRNDGFSKDVVIVQSDFDQRERILQAVLLSQYKREVAAKHRINLKPVILFKAQRTIEQSKEVKAGFHALIDELTVKDIALIRQSNIPLVRRAFRFFNDNGISDEQLVERLKHDFQREYCLSVNEEKEKVTYQVLVNTLESKTNRIRAIFAVQKLNEGWDVLNLFDIVRCYEARDTGRRKIGSTTLSEAQLVGRGARYYPFVLPDYDDRFRRKFDGDLEHELRVLEELHYHSINDSRYITEIRQALVEQGMMDRDEVIRDLVLKDSFRETPFYKYGLIWLNDRQPRAYQRVRSFADLGVRKTNYTHVIVTGRGGTEAVLRQGDQKAMVRDENREDMRVSQLDMNIVASAIARNPFYTFANLHHYFPHLNSIQAFIESADYLGGLEITFEGNIYNLAENRAEQLAGVQGLLAQIEAEIRANVTEYEGTTDFKREWVREVFGDKKLRFAPESNRGMSNSQFEHFVSTREWYAFSSLFGTSEEEGFVRMLDRQMDKLELLYDEIYLLRNEGHFAIYNFADGRAFQPDFVLFLREKSGKPHILQLFIEPKGKHLKEHDRWKERFLKDVTERFGREVIKFEDKRYRLVGVPFYSIDDENQFRGELEAALNLAPAK